MQVCRWYHCYSLVSRVHAAIWELRKFLRQDGVLSTSHNWYTQRGGASHASHNWYTQRGGASCMSHNWYTQRGCASHASQKLYTHSEEVLPTRQKSCTHTTRRCFPTHWRWIEYSYPHSRIIWRNFIFSLVFASADAADETSELIFASALWVLLIFAFGFASAPCRGGCVDYWVSSNSSLYDTKRKRHSPEKAEKQLILKKNHLSLTLNIN